MSAPGPVLLRADNFTPPARTPWGGQKLRSLYKDPACLSEVARDYSCVGESWEVSMGPELPTSLEDGTPIAEWIAAAPEHVLGEEHRRGRMSTALLVKLLDTAEALSVQIHPSDEYEGLAKDECGKPESWYVVEAEPGAGVYLGFRPGTSERDVRETLAKRRPLEPLLRFVAVEPGDFLVIQAGTPHAIGAGLTLVEPQHVLPGKRGVTYRYWDWDRRYDQAGRPDPGGELRPLHVDDALAVTRFAAVQAEDFVSRVRIKTGAAMVDAEAAVTPLCGPVSVGGLVSNWLSVQRLSGTGSTRLCGLPRLTAITVLDGEVRVGDLRVSRGRTALVPATMAEGEVSLAGAHAIVSAVV